ncbi:hypothetical protein [Micromonospora sp. NPDC003816]|uniref:hypothetical protein n=1 Tax=Micromonospora sp. NPDC003816 TaxID=3364224 RepID=UPI00368122A3
MSADDLFERALGRAREDVRRSRDAARAANDERIHREAVGEAIRQQRIQEVRNFLKQYVRRLQEARQVPLLFHESLIREIDSLQLSGYPIGFKDSKTIGHGADDSLRTIECMNRVLLTPDGRAWTMPFPAVRVRRLFRKHVLAAKPEKIFIFRYYGQLDRLANVLAVDFVLRTTDQQYMKHLNEEPEADLIEWIWG